VARQQQQQQQWLQKRRQENAQRRLAGEEPLPEEDPVLFKPVPEPSPLEGFLINNQVDNYCQQLNHLAAQTLEKLHLLDGLQRAPPTTA
jgi:translation initiation factor 3 subunit H